MNKKEKIKVINDFQNEKNDFENIAENQIDEMYNRIIKEQKKGKIMNMIDQKRVLKVKVYNKMQKSKYLLDVEKWKKDNIIMPIPYLPMYLFLKDNGEERKKGYVVIEGNNHRFYLTKEEVFKNENMRIDI